jgi:hypothetical protein
MLELSELGGGGEERKDCRDEKKANQCISADPIAILKIKWKGMCVCVSVYVVKCL